MAGLPMAAMAEMAFLRKAEAEFQEATLVGELA
jgi:hypothetical protein